MIRPWIFEFINLEPDETTPHGNGYSWYFDVWAEAEANGFEGVFFSEHHFRDTTMSPSPNLMVAALAQRTTRLRLGVMGQVLSMNEPWRVAEEIGMLDHLTDGRLEVGYSSGAHPLETRFVGIANEEVRPRYEEALEIIEQALRRRPVTFHGRFWNLDEVRLAPEVIQRPMPPRWITAISSASAQAAARRGIKVCTGFLSNDQVRSVFADYKAAADAAGQPASADQLGLRRQVLIADSDEEAQALAEVAVNNLIRRGRQRAAAQGSASGAVATAALDAPIDHGTALFLGVDESIIGSPQSVAGQIIEQCRATGAGHFLAYTFGTLARRDVAKSYHLWAEVIPILRRAEVF